MKTKLASRRDLRWGKSARATGHRVGPALRLPGRAGGAVPFRPARPRRRRLRRVRGSGCHRPAQPIGCRGRRGRANGRGRWRDAQLPSSQEGEAPIGRRRALPSRSTLGEGPPRVEHHLEPSCLVPGSTFTTGGRTHRIKSEGGRSEEIWQNVNRKCCPDLNNNNYSNKSIKKD